VADLLADMGVLAVEVPVASFQFIQADLPGELVFHACGKAIALAAPPRLFYGELFDAHRARLGVVLHAGWVLVLVEPHLFGRCALGEEQQVGLDAGVGVEHAVGQANDGVQVALGQQLFLDATLDAFTEEKAVGQHHRSAATVFEQLHDQHQEEIGGFAGAEGGGEVSFDAVFFHATERRVGDNAVDPLFRAPADQRTGQGVVVADLVRHLDAVQDHVGGGQQVRQRLLLHTIDARLQGALVLGGFYITAALVLDGASEKAARATGRVHYLLVQFGVDHAHHELGDRPRRVELARVAGVLQIAQQLFVEVAELVALLGLVEVHALLDLVDHLAQQLAGLHVVVGVFEHAAHHKGGWRVAVFVQVLQLRKQVVVDEVLQRIAGHAFRVGSPGAPATALGDGRLVVVVHQLPFQLAVIEDLEEQQPDQLTNALGVAIDADIFAHDVLDGFDGGADGHAYFLNRLSRCQAR